MSRSIEGSISRLCGRLMSCAQTAFDTINYVLEEMEFLAEQHPEREDISACIGEIKSQNKANETANWATANHWGEHFDGIDGGGESAEDNSDEVAEETEDAPDSGE